MFAVEQRKPPIMVSTGWHHRPIPVLTAAFWGFCVSCKCPVLGQSVRVKTEKNSNTWRSHEILGYVPINLVKNRLTARQVVVLSSLFGLSGGSQRRERPVSAKPQVSVSSAPLHLVVGSPPFQSESHSYHQLPRLNHIVQDLRSIQGEHTVLLQRREELKKFNSSQER